MKKLLSQFIVIILSIFIMTLFSDSIQIENWPALFIMSLTVFLVSLILKPILLLISLPFNLISLGLFSLVINAILISISDALVPGVSMGSFLNAILAGFLIMIFNRLITKKILS
ncbi:MAG: putative rane protein [Eubacteriaceae bacterium]|nr:putative rane protein [Eubacteriaceae bacterium]MDK2935224.1 putative rane protein [Eubacteriaceae bacterium]